MIKPKNILFRADSSSTIGTGHIMRDLVLAEQFKGSNIIFATQELSGNINQKIIEKNYSIETLNSNKIEELIDIINIHDINMIIIDYYAINYDHEKILKELTGITIFVLDDTYEKHHCDILLNHNISAYPANYIGLVPKYCEIRCGAKYTLLRDEFKIAKKIQRDISKKGTLTVFIAMGGADHSNRNIDILEVINNLGNIKANVVTTSANKHLNELEVYAAEHTNITVYINTDNIASLMNESDFAIVTPSVIVNEVLFMRIPFIAIQTAYNQNEIAQYLKEHNFLVLRAYEINTLIHAVKKIIDTKYYNNTLIKVDGVLKGNLG